MAPQDDPSRTERATTDWHQLEDLFHRAVELGPGERRAFLQSQSRLVPSIRRCLEALLEADAAGDTTGVATAIESSLKDSCKDARALNIANYEILGFIAEGAVGDVFLASQVHPVKRLVAVKVLKPGVVSKTITARFEAERQTLASLDHAGIAKIYDAGVTGCGRPYIAMQYVAGQPIHHFCQSNNLSLRERLSLFVQVCEAIEHAHRHGVIHRDLKSAHILVLKGEGMAQPVVIDFGIAKAKANAESKWTAEGEPLGTLYYASPEQLGLVHGTVDARSDVYALGVVLFEMLSGELPFASARTRTSRNTIYERKTATLPPKPSQVLARQTQKDADSMANRQTAAELLRGCRQELDWVCRRALEAGARHRYQSVRELAQDLRRFLDGRAVEARPPSAVYHLRKLARRHVPAAVALIIAFLGFAAAFVGLSVGVIEARKEARRAEAAQRELARALDTHTATTRFWRDLLVDSSGYPSGLPAGDRTLSQILDGLPDAVTTHLAGREEVAANVKVTAGVVFNQLGRYEEAVNLLAEGIPRLADNRGFDISFMQLELARGLQALGRFSEASAIMDRLQDTICPDAEQSSIDCCTLKSQQGLLLKQMGKLRRAVKRHRRAVEVCTQTYGADHSEVATARQNLAVALVAVRRWGEAEKEYREALAIMESKLPPYDSRRLDTMSNLGSCLVFLGRYEEAQTLLEKALQLRIEILGPRHPNVARSLAAIAELHLRTKEYREAMEMCRAGLDILERRFDEDHHEILLLRIRLGRALAGLNRDAEAEQIMVDAYERLLQRFQNDTHTYVRTAMWELYRFYKQRGRIKQAEAYWQRLGFRHTDTRTLEGDHGT